MELLEDLQNCKYKLELVNKTVQNATSSLALIEQTLSNLDYQLKGVVESRQYYKKAVDIIYERSIQELKDVLNSALGYIFHDKNLQMDIELSDKRGKSMTFVVRHNDKRVNLKRGMGMGVKCVISCILQMYYLQCKNSRKLFLDEAYSNISKEYIANFFDFVSKMCSSLHFTIVLITHDDRFVQYADRVYEISNGYVTLTKC